MTRAMSFFRFLSRQLAPLTLAGTVIAYLYPPAFLIFADTFLWFFAATMLALGVVLEPSDLKRTLQSPHRVLLGVLTQFTVMPILGFTVASFSGLPPEIALGFVIVASAPGAMASNVIVYLAGGSLAFSIAMTTVATFLSPLLTPSLVKWLGGAFMPVAFWPLFVTIIQTVLAPLLLGMWLRRRLGQPADGLGRWFQVSVPSSEINDVDAGGLQAPPGLWNTGQRVPGEVLKPPAPLRSQRPLLPRPDYGGYPGPLVRPPLHPRARASPRPRACPATRCPPARAS